MMSRRRSDFVEDRDFNFDAPADDAPLKEKLEHQKKLRKACEYCPDKPFDWPWFDPFDERWWCQVEGISPEQEEQQRQAYLERKRKRDARAA
jgi:hypothetical protein